MSNLQSILDAADKYAQQTGINLKDNPFADKVKTQGLRLSWRRPRPASGKLERVQRLSGQRSEVHRMP